MIVITTVLQKEKTAADLVSGRHVHASVLIITEEFPKARKRIFKDIKKEGCLAIYVSLNKPCFKVDALLKEEGIGAEQSFIISAVKAPSPRDAHCKTVEAVNLTDLSILINEVLSTAGQDATVVFDSVDNLFVYEDPNLVLRFIHKLLETAIKYNAGVRALSAPLAYKEFKQLYSMFDEVIRE